MYEVIQDLVQYYCLHHKCNMECKYYIPNSYKCKLVDILNNKGEIKNERTNNSIM